MKIGSLFTGYGGLDMATVAAFGATTAWVSDIDKGARKILAHRYPDVPNLGDITAIDWSTVEPVDIITGGSPCQDLSQAGRRAGMTEGTRSNLWVAMREGIAQLKPTYVIWENVRGAYSAAADSAVEHCAGCMGVGSGPYLRALGRVLGDLSDLGYDTQWRGLFVGHEDPDVWHVGGCHKRFRVFVVARLADADAPRLQGPHDPQGAASTGRRRHALSGADGDTAGLSAVQRLLPTPSVADTQGGRKARSGDRSDELLLNGLAAEQRFGQYAAAVQRWETVTGVPAPAPTAPTGKNGAHQLSPKFTEWMMGLPPGWITDAPGITRNEALRACGNGVVPQQAYAAITHALGTFQLLDARGAAA